MLSSSLFWPLCLLGLFDVVLSDCHSGIPLVLHVGNVSDQGSAASRWGVSLRIGTPPQNIAAVINADENNTSLRGVNKQDSETWTEADDTDIPEDTIADGTVSGRDTLHLNPNVAIDDFPFISSSSRAISSSFVGLGRNSTILDSLVQQGTIASKTWSLFWGRQGTAESQQMNGGLTLGGYDKAKIAGNGLASGFSNGVGCPSSLVVEVGSISLDGEEGSIPLSSDVLSVRMCIRPDSPFTTLPKNVYERLKEALPGGRRVSLGIYEGGLLYQNEEGSTGNMTFKLSAGPLISVPDHQLIVPNKRTDAEKILLISDSDLDTSELPILGQSFLSSSYLHVDNELEQFTIWPANPTEETELISVDHRLYSSECIDSQTRLKSRSAPKQDTREEVEDERGEGEGEEPPPPPARPILEGGGMPGVALGVVVGAVFIFLVGFFVHQFLVQRRLRRRSRSLFGN